MADSLARILEDPDVEVRLLALKATIQVCDEARPVALDCLRLALHNKNAEVRRRVIDYLRRLDPPAVDGSLEALETVGDDPGPRARMEDEAQ